LKTSSVPVKSGRLREPFITMSQSGDIKASGFPPYPWIWLGVTAIIILLDWYTKQLATESLELYRPHEVFSWLNMTLAHNYGAAFSFLSDAGGWQRWFFTILASGVSLALLIWLLRLPREEWLTGLGLSLILGGAIGNLIDRVQLGYVVDFVDVHYKGWHYPAFNVADSAITCGVILLLFDVVLISRKKAKAK
jgi:signal peptidase II